MAEVQTIEIATSQQHASEVKELPQQQRNTGAMGKPQRGGTRGDRRHGRSRITNSGDELLADIDGRSGLARRYKDIVAALLADQAGATECSEARKQLIRRFAAASCLAEALESRLVNGEQIDIAEHTALSSTLVRLSARIGIDRRARNITPTLSDYISGLNTREAAR